MEKLVEREGPGKNLGGERARLFELESSTWNKLSANNFRTHTHTDCGHTYTVACVSSPLLVSMRLGISRVWQVSSVKIKGEHNPHTRSQTSRNNDNEEVVQSYPHGSHGNSSYVGEYPDALLLFVVYIPTLVI